jgi:hypothetical protein
MTKAARTKPRKDEDSTTEKEKEMRGKGISRVKAGQATTRSEMDLPRLLGLGVGWQSVWVWRVAA